jgi:cell fate regulator YaaT (PSP1 superfamily)
MGCCNNSSTEKKSRACVSCNYKNQDVFDWLGFLGIETKSNYVEVRFKGGRKNYYLNDKNINLITGEPVIVDSGNGYHLGFVSLQGELVNFQLKKKSVDTNEILTVLRKATRVDIEKFEYNRKKELPTLIRSREIIRDLKLEMKLSDVEYQADGTKATFYYSADDRVDFRELIKILAHEFKIRVEMRQISLRHEASRIGGIGVCGRELCCSTWISEFKNITTSAAKYQNLSLNPAKLTGQCGRLKCCLNYELETYIQAWNDIPVVEQPIKTQKGELKLQKTDIFRKILWFAYQEEANWIPLKVDTVVKLLELNKKGLYPEDVKSDFECMYKKDNTNSHKFELNLKNADNGQQKINTEKNN